MGRELIINCQCPLRETLPGRNIPSYFYGNLDEREAFEYNNLYFKEINELQLQVKESGRTINQLVAWEIMALELIKQTGLPVAKNAEDLLMKNDKPTEMHSIEPFPVYLQNQNTISLAYFNYNLSLVPNPAMYNTTLGVEIPLGISMAQLKLFDAYNNNGLLQTHSLQEGINSVSIDVSGLISGMYIINIEVDGVLVTSGNLIVIH